MTAPLLALATGPAIGGALGAGGSALAVPALLYVWRQDPDDAMVGSLLIVTAGATVAAVLRARSRDVCWRLVCGLSVAWPIGTVLGVLVDRILDAEAVLVVVTLAAAVRTWQRATGFSTGATGVGGGFLVPVLTLVSRPLVGCAPGGWVVGWPRCSWASR